jgi:hypothetical protein
MICVRATGRARSVRSIALSSCAVLALAGIMVLGAFGTGPRPARAQFGVGFPLGFGSHHGKVRWSRRRRSRYSRRRNQDDGPEPEIERAGTGTAPAADPGRPAVRPSSAPSESRPASGRPQPRGPDLEPSK